MTQPDLLSRLLGDVERRSPGSDEISRRIAALCGINPTTRVLDLGCGTGPTARLLTREYGCAVTCVDHDPAALEQLAEAAGRDGSFKRPEPLLADLRTLDLPANFEVVVAEGSARHLAPTLGEAAVAVRRFLRRNGRIAFSCLSRVGRGLPAEAEAFFREAGEPMLPPRELTAQLERAGYEPLAVEAYANTVLDEHHRLLEKALARLEGDPDPQVDRLRREIELFRREGVRQSVAVMLLVARRKEPGERPVAMRDSD